MFARNRETVRIFLLLGGALLSLGLVVYGPELEKLMTYYSGYLLIIMMLFLAGFVVWEALVGD